ncbi:putative N-acetyltransferase CML1 [Gastrophryne carolinensis]
MTSYIVRPYRTSDFPSVKKIFTSGCQEHAYSAFSYTMKLPRNWLLLLAGFLLPLLTVGSILVAILDVIAILLVLWLCGREFFYSYAIRALDEDLKDINKYYLQREGYNFWVVESNGEVVGMVAAEPLFRNGGEKYIELKRMSVANNQRGKGIAKILCRTVIDFARKTGCKAVTLSTTTAQVGPIQLYTKMGFTGVHTSSMTKFTERLVGLIWLELQFHIPCKK